MASCKSIWESDSNSEGKEEEKKEVKKSIENKIEQKNRREKVKREPSQVLQIPLNQGGEKPNELTREIKKRIKDISRKVNVSFPQNDDDEQCIIIRSDNLSQLEALKMKISSILRSKSQPVGFTHFISIAFTDVKIRKNFEEFKNIVINKYATPGNKYNLDENLFQNPLKLHMTLDILWPLTDASLKEKAISTLNACSGIVKQVIPENGKLKVDVKGLGYFGNSPEEARVLFAKVGDKEGLLQKLADSFVDKFESEGLLQPKYKGPVKCHITLLNKTFRDRKVAYDKSETSEKGKRRRNKKPGGQFNVKTLMQELEEFEFGKEIPIDWVHLSTAREVDGETGFYLSLHKLGLS